MDSEGSSRVSTDATLDVDDDIFDEVRFTQMRIILSGLTHTRTHTQKFQVLVRVSNRNEKVLEKQPQLRELMQKRQFGIHTGHIHLLHFRFHGMSTCRTTNDLHENIWNWSDLMLCCKTRLIVPHKRTFRSGEGCTAVGFFHCMFCAWGYSSGCLCGHSGRLFQKKTLLPFLGLSSAIFLLVCWRLHCKRVIRLFLSPMRTGIHSDIAWF